MTTTKAKKAPPAKANAKKKTPKPKVGPFPYNVGPSTISVIVDGRTHTVPKVSDVAHAIRSGDWAKVAKLVTPGRAIASAIKDVRQHGDVTIRDDGGVYYRGRLLNNGSAKQILKLISEGFPIASEIRTLDNLMKHDDPNVIAGFEDFLQRWNIPRLEDGRIVLYKRVRDDLSSSYDGSFKYAVGKVAELSWDQVDRDGRNTCSRGLHATPLEALHNFSDYGGAVLELHVWPEDFAALPTDYLSNGKVRLRRVYVARKLSEAEYKASLASAKAA